jgi:hypothetical protein
VAWLFLITFSQFYNEKREQKDLKNLQFDQKSLSNIGAKDSEESSTIKKKPSTLHQDNRKDDFRASQTLARPHPL